MALKNIPSITIGTDRIPLAASSIRCENGFTVRADKTNSGTVYLGGSEVANDGSQGMPIEAGESIDVTIRDLHDAFAIATGTGQKLHFLAGEGL
jgi:hypothetical protein